MNITIEGAALLEIALIACFLVSYVILCAEYPKRGDSVWMIILKIFGIIPVGFIATWFWDAVINLFFRFRP